MIFEEHNDIALEAIINIASRLQLLKERKIDSTREKIFLEDCFFQKLGKESKSKVRYLLGNELSVKDFRKLVKAAKQERDKRKTG